MQINGMIGFQANVAHSLEVLAKENLVDEMLQRHPNAKLLDTNIIKADDGALLEVFAAGYASGCSYVTEAKFTPTLDSVDQLADLIIFIEYPFPFSFPHF